MEHISMATAWIASRQAARACASQYAASSAVRPSTCPNSPWSPDRSKKQVCQRSASKTYSPVSASVRHRGRPRRCSSIPRCATGPGGCSSTGSAMRLRTRPAPAAMTARTPAPPASPSARPQRPATPRDHAAAPSSGTAAGTGRQRLSERLARAGNHSLALPAPLQPHPTLTRSRP